MDFDSIVLMRKQDGKFLYEGFSISIEKCFDNIKEFYEEDGKIFLTLNLEQEFSDEEFYNIVENFDYDEFENLGVGVSIKDEEYYPTFLFEICDLSVEHIKLKIHSILDLFDEKVVKIYCNNM